MNVELRTNRWQLALMWCGWFFLAFLVSFGFAGFATVAGGVVVFVVFVYVAWAYPIACTVSNEGVCIRTLIRRRIIRWSQILEIRRTRGPLRRHMVEGKSRLRPAPGALLFVLDDDRKVLALGHAEDPGVRDRLVAVVETVSPALADSLRLHKW